MDQFDAVVFHHPAVFKKHSTLPERRSPRQRYVFLTRESPAHAPPPRSFEAHVFNWTMTYRSDSDFYFPYGRIKKRFVYCTTIVGISA